MRNHGKPDRDAAAHAVPGTPLGHRRAQRAREPRPEGPANTYWYACKHCGKKRAFANSTESVMWERGNTVRSELRIVSKPQTVKLADDESYEE